jgi:hypothetical protein
MSFPIAIGLVLFTWAMVVFFMRRAFGSSRTRATFGRDNTITRFEMRTQDIKTLGDVPSDLRDGEVLIEEHDLFQIEGPDGVKRTFHSLDEMPADIRAGFEQQLKAAGKDWRSFESSAPSGDHLKSSGQIPPEIRRQLTQLASQHKSGQSVTIEVEGPDGRKHTYHSLEELPPEARALYEQVVRLKAEAEGPSDGAKRRH